MQENENVEIRGCRNTEIEIQKYRDKVAEARDGRSRSWIEKDRQIDRGR